MYVVLDNYYQNISFFVIIDIIAYHLEIIDGFGILCFFKKYLIHRTHITMRKSLFTPKHKNKSMRLI